MTCKQLGGACDFEFSANTFEEMAQQSKLHGMDMFQKGDAAHMEVIQKTVALSMDPVAMQAWMDEKKALFDAQPEA